MTQKIPAFAPYIGEDLSAPRQYALTVTGTNWTTARAVGVPYKTLDGAWRLRFNVEGSLSVASAVPVLTVTGVTFKNATNANQVVQAAQDTDNTTYLIRARALLNSSTLDLRFSAAISIVYVSGDVELDAKPAFVP